MAFTFGAGDLARGCVNMQLLILPNVAWLATCHSDARFGSRARRILREIKVQQLVS